VSDTRGLLRAFLVAALVAGLVTAAFHLVVSERYVDRAIAIEEQVAERDHGAGNATAERHEDLFSRETQKSGLVAGALLYALAAGAVFAGVYALVAPRLPGRRPRSVVLRLGGATLLGVVLVTFLKYPATPPGVGDPGTLARRQLLYVGCLLLSVAGLWLAVRSGRLLRGRYGDRAGRAAGAVFFVAWVAAILLLLPNRTDPVNTPATLLWQFRAASLGGQILFWILFSALFAVLLERAARDSSAPAAAP
jgi:hypothetical protein